MVGWVRGRVRGRVGLELLALLITESRLHDVFWCTYLPFKITFFGIQRHLENPPFKLAFGHL